jgi:hypothetical protein
MQSLMITDLEIKRELSDKECAGVHGGTSANSVGALMVGSTLLNGASGVSIGSPVVQANPQSQTITPTATDVNFHSNIASILQSANTLLGQF